MAPIEKMVAALAEAIEAAEKHLHDLGFDSARLEGVTGFVRIQALRDVLASMPGWLQNATTQAQVKVFLLDRLYEALPRPPFTEAETEEIASRVYDYVWQRSAGGNALAA